MDKETERTATNVVTERSKESQPKLERVPLPTFSGQMEQYPMFWDDWKALVVNNLDELF